MGGRGGAARSLRAKRSPGRTVERHAGDHEVVDGLALDLLQRHVQDSALALDAAEGGLVAETLADDVDEGAVDLDDVEPVVGLEGVDEDARDRARAGADLEDAA